MKRWRSSVNNIETPPTNYLFKISYVLVLFEKRDLKGLRDSRDAFFIGLFPVGIL